MRSGPGMIDPLFYFHMRIFNAPGFRPETVVVAQIKTWMASGGHGARNHGERVETRKMVACHATSVRVCVDFHSRSCALGQDISLRFSGAFSEWHWKHQFSKYQRNSNSRSLRPPARWRSPTVSLSFSTFLWPARRFSIESAPGALQPQCKSNPPSFEECHISSNVCCL